MEWCPHFKAVFFAAWENQGLPAPAPWQCAYDRVFRKARARSIPDISTQETNGPLAIETLRQVHGFGIFFSNSVGRLLSLSAPECARRAGWCGRFNLGISLFDHLSDEAGLGDDLLFLEPFLQLLPASHPRCASTTNPSPVLNYLRSLATDVLRGLEEAVGPSRKRGRRDRLWRSVEEMLLAEGLVARTGLLSYPNTKQLVEACRTKSAGPFATMAEWMALAPPATSHFRGRARDLGEALGDCYWLVDDARDLWEDLDAGHANFFLLAAMQDHPRLFQKGMSSAAELELSRILLAPGWVERLIAPVIARVHSVLKRSQRDPSVREEVAGLLAVSMERWLR